MALWRNTPSVVGRVPRRLVIRARLALLVERFWPPAVAVLAVLGLFLTVSWLGFWLLVPAWARPVGLVLFLLGAALAARRTWRGGLPGRASILARLDRDSGLPHRPVSTADDTLGNASADPATRALWDLHRRRLDAVLGRIGVRLPSPRMQEIDTYAVRAAVLVAVVAAATVAGPDRDGRLGAAFQWRDTPADAAAARIDAWIDPPPYTKRPPLVLLGSEAADRRAPDAVLSAPVGSTVVVRSGQDDVPTAVAGEGLKPVAPKAGPGAANPTAYRDQRFTLTGDGSLALSRDGGTIGTYRLKAVPDLPPRITLEGSATANYRGTLDLGYRIEDDYGVTGAEVRFAAPIVRGRPVTGRSLVEAPHAALTLPALPGGLGEAKTTVDLSDHPWAGAVVTMTLAAHDEGGNTGEGAPVTLTLPAKPFTKPLAKALVEQRRDLVLDPDDRAAVAMALDALSLSPDVFDVSLAESLGLHTAQIRLDAAKTDADLLGVADFLWEMALRIENGDLNRTEADLRAAQQALSQAIDRGASPDEIRKLTDALRAAMDRYLSEMMRNSDRPGQREEAMRQQNGRTVTDKDLQSMLDRMEEAARKGDTAEAQRLLDQLKSLMENLRAAKPGSGGQSQATREMNRSMSDLDRMMKEQGDVRDKTFQEDGGQGDDQAEDGGEGASGDQPNDGSSDGSSGQPGGRSRSGKGRPSLGELQGRQGALGQQLEALQRKLRGLGMGSEQGLADAGQAMKEAEGALGRGDARGAVEAQGRALEGLQRGASGLQGQMAQQGGQDGPAEADGTGGQGQSQDGQDLDPLGRSRTGGQGRSNSSEFNSAGGPAARAQRVLQELRNRLSDPSRSQDELDYLERLLKSY